MESSSINNGIIALRVLFTILPIIMGAVHCIWRRNAPTSSKVEYFLGYFLTIGVGFQNLLIGHLEINYGDLVATYTGWANTPYLAELGRAHIAFGTLGILSFWFRGGWRAAAAVGYGIYVLLTGISYLRHYFYDSLPYHEFIGAFIITDFVMAACLFLLLFLRRLMKT